ncbi:MAG: ankyrin repeat domain-containing protein [Phycisphaerae bacterium]
MKLQDLAIRVLIIGAIIGGIWYAKYRWFDRPAEQAERLVEAVKQGDLDRTQNLLDDGADVNRANADGWYPLFAAVVCNNDQMIRLLREHGAETHTASPPAPPSGSGSPAGRGFG